MTVDERPRPREAPAAAEPGSDRLGSAALRLRLDAACALALFLVALAWFGLTFDRSLNLTDEGYLLRLGQRVAQGETPHHDFIEDYGPGVLYALAALVAGGDGEIAFVRRALAVWKALAVVLGFACARVLVPLPVAAGVGLLSIVFWGRASLNVNAPHAAIMTIPFCMAAAGVLAVALSDRHRLPTRGLLVAAGVLGAVAVLLKQSLGVMNAYGLALAIGGAALAGLDPEPSRAPTRPAESERRSHVAWLGVWAVAGALLLVPGWRYLGWREYAVHLAAVHAWMICIAFALLRRRVPPGLGAFVRDRVLPFASGGLVPLLGVALAYLAIGSLDDLMTGMFERPLRRRNYATPTVTPPASIATFALGCAGMGSGAALALTGRARRAAGVTFGVGALLVALAVLVIPHSNPRLYTPRVLARSAMIFDWVVHTGTLVAAVALFGPRLARGEDDPAERARLRAVLPLFFFSAMLCFQVFPRGAHNVWMAHAAWMPLLGVVLHESFRRLRPGLAPLRRIALAALLCIPPLWLAWPVASRTWRLHDQPARSLALPRTTGMEVQLSSIERWHLADAEALVAHLSSLPAGPLLLVGGDVMLHHLSGRPPLRPEHEYALYNVVLDMLPLRELAALEDGEWVARLEDTPGAVVVVQRDASGGRVRAALPSLDAHLRARHRVAEQFGPYELWERVGR